MSESPAPPKPPNPVEAAKHAHKGIKGKMSGHPKWVYIAGGVVLIGVAFLVWQRSRGQAGGVVAPDATAGPPMDAPFFPDATQGAFGGYNDPTTFDDTTGDAAGAGATDDPRTPINIYVGQPAPTSGDAVSPVGTVPAMPTGGGTTVARTVTAHTTPATTLASQFMAAAKATGTGPYSPYPATTPPPGFPNKGADGWFRKEYDSKRKRHYHQYQDGHRVWL